MKAIILINKSLLEFLVDFDVFARLADWGYIYLSLKGFYTLLEVGILLDDKSILDFQLLLSFYWFVYTFYLLSTFGLYFLPAVEHLFKGHTWWWILFVMVPVFDCIL